MIEIKDLGFDYNGKPVLDGVSLEIIPGEVLGILGPNGCGKTTLLRTLNKNLSPREGCILLEGDDLAEMTKKDIAKKIAVVPQTNEIKFAFTVKEIVSMGRMPFIESFSGESNEDLEIIDDSMKKARIWDFRNRRINTMSGGERQRAIIARALAQTPKYLLMDEPTLHLDVNHQIEALEMVKKLSDETGLTVVIVSHDLQIVSKYCDRVIMLKDHRIFAAGTPDEALTPENMAAVFNIDAVYEYDVTLKSKTVKIIGSCKK